MLKRFTENEKNHFFSVKIEKIIYKLEKNKIVLYICYVLQNKLKECLQ